MVRNEQIRSIERRSYSKRANIFRALGLNTRGAEYKRTPPIDPIDRPSHCRAMNLAKYHRRTKRRMLLGQNSRGGPRKYLIILGATDKAVLQAEIDALCNDLAALYEILPEHSQAKAVSLANSIGSLKMRIREVGA